MDPEFAAKYLELARWHWWFRGRQKILAKVLQRELAAQRAQLMLAVGAGPPERLSWLTEFVTPDGYVVGLDIDRIHACAPPPLICHVVGDLLSPPLRPATMDVVLALDVLEHLDDDAAGLQEAARLLRPGGVLVATVPAFPSLWGPHDEINRHRRRYTKHSLRQAFSRAGVPLRRLTYFNAIFFPMAAAVRWGRRVAGITASGFSDVAVNGPGRINDLMASVFGWESHLASRISLPVGVSLLAIARIPLPAGAGGAGPPAT